MSRPEDLARDDIDAALEASGWTVQDADKVNLDAAPGVAVREFPLKSGHGFADYLLFDGGSALGVVEAKPSGYTLTGVETQAAKYSEGLPDELTAPVRPLPYLYQSTGVETRFTNGLDPEPRSREVFGFHRPETLGRHFTHGGVLRRRTTAEGTEVPANFNWCMHYQLPELPEGQLWPVQVRAVERLEASFAEARRRALIQMSTGSGKTYSAVTSIYRLIKHGGARRVLFVVDRRNLGRQALREFQEANRVDPKNPLPFMDKMVLNRVSKTNFFEYRPTQYQGARTDTFAWGEVDESPLRVG